MSHFSVAVFTDEDTTVDELLEPYCEDIDVEPYVYMNKKEFIEQGKQEIKKCFKIYKEYMKDKRAFRRKHKGKIEFLRNVKKIPSMKKWNKERIFKYATRYYDEDEISEDGSVYSTANPNARWDWFSIGGRWENMLILKSDNPNKIIRTNSALVKDIDWDRMKRIRWLLTKPYKTFFDNLFLDKEFYQKLYPDEKTYLDIATSFSTYSVVTPDGEWHDSGRMGWWGISESTDDERVEFERNYNEKFLKNLNPEWELTIVDCHI